jgi:hypothetical protein
MKKGVPDKYLKYIRKRAMPKRVKNDSFLDLKSPKL